MVEETEESIEQLMNAMKGEMDEVYNKYLELIHTKKPIEIVPTQFNESVIILEQTFYQKRKLKREQARAENKVIKEDIEKRKKILQEVIGDYEKGTIFTTKDVAVSTGLPASKVANLLNSYGDLFGAKVYIEKDFNLGIGYKKGWVKVDPRDHRIIGEHLPKAADEIYQRLSKLKAGEAITFSELSEELNYTSRSIQSFLNKDKVRTHLSKKGYGIRHNKVEFKCNI